MSNETTTEKFVMTKEIHNALVDAFQKRAETQGFKGKKKLELQAEFFIGAVATIDLMNGSPEHSCMSPMIAFSIMRGVEIKKFETEKA